VSIMYHDNRGGTETLDAVNSVFERPMLVSHHIRSQSFVSPSSLHNHTIFTYHLDSSRRCMQEGHKEGSEEYKLAAGAAVISNRQHGEQGLSTMRFVSRSTMIAREASATRHTRLPSFLNFCKVMLLWLSRCTRERATPSSFLWLQFCESHFGILIFSVILYQ